MNWKRDRLICNCNLCTNISLSENNLSENLASLVQECEMTRKLIPLYLQSDEDIY